MEERLFKFIEDNRDNIVDDLIDLISIPSITGSDEVEKALDKYINKAENYGLHSSTILDKKIGLIDIGRGDETIGVLVHLDVVPEGDSRKWTVNPFRGILNQGYIWGRGALDNKGPCIAVLYALLAVKSLGMEFKTKIRIIVGTQEESGWKDIELYKKNYALPDYGFTPDGEFPINNREKGYADVLLTFSAGEKKGELELIEICGGTAENTIPDHAYAVIRGNQNTIKYYAQKYNSCFLESNISLEYDDDMAKVICTGKACHSSMPENGVNAIGELCCFLHSLPLGQNALSKLTDFIIHYIYHDYYGVRLGFENRLLFFNGEYMGKTVLSPTIVRTKNKKACLNINIRTAYGTDEKALSTVFDKHSSEYDYSYQIKDYLQPLYVKRDLPFLNSMCYSYEKVTGEECEYLLAYGSSYAKAMPNIVNFGPIFPDDEDTCHQPDERISVENLIKCCKIYALALAKMAL